MQIFLLLKIVFISALPFPHPMAMIGGTIQRARQNKGEGRAGLDLSISLLLTKLFKLFRFLIKGKPDIKAKACFA
jgi:hypothetical protein